MADAFDYIIVGSGAGGGTLAARLAEAARSVLLLESGGDSRRLAGTNDYQPGINWLPDDYDGLRSVARGATLPPAAARSGCARAVACSAAIFGCTARRDYGSSTHRCSLGYPVSLSPVWSIWSAKRPRT